MSDTHSQLQTPLPWRKLMVRHILRAFDDWHIYTTPCISLAVCYKVDAVMLRKPNPNMTTQQVQTTSPWSFSIYKWSSCALIRKADDVPARFRRLCNVAIWGAQLAPHLYLPAGSQRNTSGKSKPILLVVSIRAKYAKVGCQKKIKVSVGAGVLTNTPLLTILAMT